MERLKKFNWIIISLIVLACILTAGYVVLSHPGLLAKPVPDPETGIQNWITSVNNHDVQRLYQLLPDAIGKQVNESTFALANEDNPLFAPGLHFKNYTVIKKRVDGNAAQITVQIMLARPPTQNGTVLPDLPLVYTFLLSYEHGEWKIWEQE